MKYILIHGTFDTDESLAGDRWWQKGSQFWQKLTEHVAEEDIIQFRWSGENSQRDREAAAEDLHELIKNDLNGEKAKIIAHSHGGNVGYLARKALPSSSQSNTSLTTIGTPFLNINTLISYRYTGLERFFLFVLALIVFFLNVLPLEEFCLSFGYTSCENLYVFGDLGKWWHEKLRELDWYDEELAFLIAQIIAGLAVLTAARPQLLRLIEIVRNWMFSGNKDPEGVVVVRHQADEAIALLKNLYSINLRPVSAGQVVTSFVGLATPLSWLAALASPFLIMGLFFGFEEYGEIIMYFLGLTEVGLGGPAVFVGVFVLSFMLVLPALSSLLWLVGVLLSVPTQLAVKTFLHRGLKSSAFGLPAGRIVSGVSEVPGAAHTVRELSEDIARALAEDSAEALGGRVSELKHMLGDAIELNDDSFKVLMDTFQWNELIHTYYFRHPGCCQFIVDTVVGHKK